MHHKSMKEKGRYGFRSSGGGFRIDGEAVDWEFVVLRPNLLNLFLLFFSKNFF